MPDLFQEVQTQSAARHLAVAPWVRRAFLALFAAFAIVALVDVFGQQPHHRAAAAPAAELRLSAPAAVRGGLLFQSRIEVRARRAIEHPRLVLDRGWLEEMQTNTIEPSPVSEASRDGRVVLSYDALEPGDVLVVWIEFQVNPTNVGRRSYDVELDDATTPVVRIDHRLTVLP